MWAQMIRTRMRAGQEDALRRLQQEMETRFQASQIGPKRVIVLQDEHEPSSYITLIFFENEARAREYEDSPQQQEIQQRMSEIWEGQPQFTDLNVVYELNR